MQKIEIKTVDDKIKFVFQGIEKEFGFDSIDWLIDEFLKLDINEKIEVETENDELNNYKKLIEELFMESQKKDFRETYNLLNRHDISNEEIIQLLKIEMDSSTSKK